MARVAEAIHWLGHDAMRIDAGDVVIYIDPWQLGDRPKKADIVLITHDHRDHCSPEDVEAVKIIGPQLAIPMHVGRGIGAMDDAERFKELSPVPARVLPVK